MKYLIDTHICLWAVAEKEKLSARVTDILENPDNEILYSQISLMEIAIKYQTGKLSHFDIDLPAFTHILLTKEFTLLSLTNEHLFAYFNSNFFSDQHRDPFDRCLIAIANYEKVAFITKDEKFDLYKERVAIVW